MLNFCLLWLLWLFTFDVVCAGADPITFDYDGGNRRRIGYDCTFSQTSVYDIGIVRAGSVREIEPSGDGLSFVGLVGFLAAETAVPRGFASADQFNQAVSELKMALSKRGITDASIRVRGSSVTGVGFGTGQPFSAASDIDFFVESRQLTQGLRTSQNIPGFVNPNLLNSTYDPIAEWSQIWSENLGRNVSVGGFQPGTVPAGPVIRP